MDVKIPDLHNRLKELRTAAAPLQPAIVYVDAEQEEDKHPVVHFGGHEWLVLDIDVYDEKDDKRVLLLSKDIVGQMAYDSRGIRNWKDCEIRSYLNNVFLNSFSDISGLMKDKVVIAGIVGYKVYENGELSAKIDGRGQWWWLRTPGNREKADGAETCVMRVMESGELGMGGFSARVITGGIRPALWVDLNNERR